jgi:hypothetical protein
VHLLLGPSTASYFQWVCGGLDALIRQSSTDSRYRKLDIFAPRLLVADLHTGV